MAKFAYNNIKNAKIGHTPFKLNCGYHLRILFKKDVNPNSKSCYDNKLAKKLRKLMKVYYQNLFYI